MIEITKTDHEFWEFVCAGFPCQKGGKVEAVITNGLVEKYKVFSAENAADEKRAIGALGQDFLTKVECGLLRKIIGDLRLSCYCEWYYGFRGVYSITLKKINLHPFTARKLINVLAEVNDVQKIIVS